MSPILVAAALLAAVLGALAIRAGRSDPADRYRSAGGIVGIAFLISHGFQVLSAVRIAQARENLALLGPKATPRDLCFGVLVTLQPSFAGLLLLAVVVLAAGIATVGRGRGPRLLAGLALLVAVPMAIGAFPVPGPDPSRAAGATALHEDIHPLFVAVGWERRFGLALPLLVAAAVAFALRARRERLALLASGTAEQKEDARRVLAGAGLLLFATAGMLVEVLAFAPAESAVLWGRSARTGWDLWLPWVLAALLPAAACAAGVMVALRFGYHGLRRRKG